MSLRLYPYILNGIRNAKIEGNVSKDSAYIWQIILHFVQGNQVWHYENTPIQIYRRFHLQKLKNNSDKKPDIFHISAQNIDCGYSLELPRRGGSNEYPQSMFSNKTKKNNVYPCKPQFYYISGV